MTIAASVALIGCAGTKTGDAVRERTATVMTTPRTAKEHTTAVVDKVLAKDWTLWLTRFSGGRWGFGFNAGTFGNPAPAKVQPTPAPIVVIRDRDDTGKKVRRVRR